MATLSFRRSGTCWLVVQGVAFALLALVALLPALPANAAETFVVNTTSDATGDGDCGDSTCTLREAIMLANANNNQPNIDTITFNFSGTAVRTFNIASALPTITEPLIIDGRSHDLGDGTPLIKFDGGQGDYDGIRANAGGSAEGTGVWLLSLIIVRFGQNGVEFSATGGNVVSNCFIGVDTAGTDLGNLENGIRINGSNNNLIGPSFGGGRNVISANRGSGVLIERVVPFPPIQLQQSTGNVISANRIGTNPGGTSERPNWGSGVSISRAGNQVGGTSAASTNIIAGNLGNGVTISGAAATGNVVSGNYIGTNGVIAIPNSNGVLITGGPSGNVVGGTAPGGYCSGPCNLISGNTGVGVYVNESASNSVRGNVIGLNSAVGARLPNGGEGVRVSGNSPGDTVGGTAFGDGNVIAGNGGTGLLVTAPGVTVQGNYIGTNHLGAAGLFNAGGGIQVQGSNCTIGGSSTAARNIISGNTGIGLDLLGGTGCQVLKNYVGLAPNGATALPNTSHGIRIATLFGSTSTIGGAGTGNVVSGNGGQGISIDATGVTVRGNIVGLNATGAAAVPNVQNGILITTFGSPITIGGPGAGEGNTISGNGLNGIASTAGGAAIAGNIIGLDAGGASVARPNGGSGILLNPSLGGASGSTIRANTISGNLQSGIDIRANSGGNLIAGNRIGTNGLGTAAAGNVLHGIVTEGPGTVIGGSAEADRNIISGNGEHGVFLAATATGSTITGNYIGVNASAAAALPNGNGADAGVWVDAAANTTIGGLAPGEGNVISGNAGYGVYLADAAPAALLGNKIGTDSAGNLAVPNTYEGVVVDGSLSRVQIGAPGAGNVISGNAYSGVYLASGTSQSIIEANVIGANASGTAALPNGFEGVYIDGSATNSVGGVTPGAGNLISGNTGRGVRIEGAGATGNVVAGNYIGTNATGTAALANGSHGVHLFDGASNNLIGGVSAGARNIISSNTGRGVYLFGMTTSGNAIRGNYIGTDVTGSVDLGNGDGGIVAEDAPQTIVGGGNPIFTVTRTLFSESGNLISGNVANGVEFNGMAANGVVRGNFIGTDVTGTFAIPNDLDGVRTDANNTAIGGSGNGEGNLISGNKANGVRIQGASSGVTIAGNGIGVQADGVSPLGNGSSGEPNNHGIRIFMNATDSMAGGTQEGEGNVIAFNFGDGVRVEGLNAVRHTVRRNSIHSNGGKGIETLDGGNTELAPPAITATGPIAGTACANCVIEIFSDSVDEGRVYHASVQADGSGAWAYAGAVTGPFVTATATDAAGNTSEFSTAVAVVSDTQFDLVAGATGHLWTGDPVPLASLDTFPGLIAPGRAFTAVTALFGWNNADQRFDFWFRGFPLGFQTLTDGLETGGFYFFQSPGGTIVTVPNGTLYSVPGPGGSFPTSVGATGRIWSGSAVSLAQMDDPAPPGLPAAVSAVFRWENSIQLFQFWFRGFPDNFQTLANGLVHGEHYFFQSNQVVQVPMD